MMDKKDLLYFKDLLLKKREELVKNIEYLRSVTTQATSQEASGDHSAYSFHMADQGTDAMEREKQFLMASKEGRYLWHVNQALRRLYSEPKSFGTCHSCGTEIDFERLDALPHARLCITCKAKEEDGERR